MARAGWCADYNEPTSLPEHHAVEQLNEYRAL